MCLHHSNASHDIDDLYQVPPLLDTVSNGLLSCRETCAALANLVPPDQFWKWKDMWSISLRNAVFAATMVGYLRTGKLLTLAEVTEILDSALSPNCLGFLLVH